MNKDLLWIKKHYSEKFSHLCRNLFPTLLETNGLLPKIIDDHFDHSKFLYDDIVNNGLENEFKNYIYNFIDVENNNQIIEIEDPKTLLENVGYNLYECKSEKDIEEFKKYYAPCEELCTFKGGRLNSCYVFFAVKKDVDNIKREDFPNPSRQDEYGTSVISIQFTKGLCNTLSIKNRYNHAVNNPDATFSNNLDNIISGLTKSFEKWYNLNINYQENSFEIPNYVVANDGKFYKYNYEKNNIYFCPNNVIIDNFNVKKLNNRFIIMDWYILDLTNKRIDSLCEYKFDSFIDSICEDIKKVKYTTDKEKNKIIELYINLEDEPIIIKVNKYGIITGYINKYVKEIGRDFLEDNEILEEIELPNCEEIYAGFLFRNKSLRKIELPKCKKIHFSFLYDNELLNEINLPNCEEIYDEFLFRNKSLRKMELPNVEKIGDAFLKNNEILEEIELPKCRKIGSGFLAKNKLLKEINLPNVTNIDSLFLLFNEVLERISIPKLEIIEYSFLVSNKALRKIELPNVEKIGDAFLKNNEILEEIELPKCKKIGSHFLEKNKLLKEINLPNVTNIDKLFLVCNEVLERIYAPKLEKIDYNYDFLDEIFEEIEVPKCKKIGSNFYNKIIIRKHIL